MQEIQCAPNFLCCTESPTSIVSVACWTTELNPCWVFSPHTVGGGGTVPIDAGFPPKNYISQEPFPCT